MISRSTLLHLRIPFSFYLMPVFFFAASTNIFSSEFLPGPPLLSIYDKILSVPYEYLYPSWHEYLTRVILVFFSIHLFLYPASNGFNSYYDKDEKAIGGLENPPPVSRELLFVSLSFDLVAIMLGVFVSWEFALMLFIYGVVSKAYSHPAIRLKKYGILAWLTAGIFQGGFTFFMVVVGLRDQGFSHLGEFQFLFPAVLATLMILGFYPLTQIYQHEEDAKHGDNTISRMAGIKGTFILSSTMFLLATLGFYILYGNSFELTLNNTYLVLPWFLIFLLFTAPVFSFFMWWLLKTRSNESAANYRNTMRMNKIASLCLVLFFIFYGVYHGLSLFLV